MSLQIKAEQQMYINVCVELQKTPVETKKLLEQTQTSSTVSRALVYRWHRRFSDYLETPYDSKGAGRPSVIIECSTPDFRQVVRRGLIQAIEKQRPNFSKQL